MSIISLPKTENQPKNFSADLVTGYIRIGPREPISLLESLNTEKSRERDTNEKRISSQNHFDFIVQWRSRIGNNHGYSNTLLEKVRTTTFLLAGVGTIGGQAGLRLAEWGAESIIAIDPDSPGIHNLSRQAATYSDVVKNTSKPDAFKQIVESKNPYAKIDSRHEAITPENAEKYVTASDIIIDAIDIAGIDGIIALHEEACRQKKVVITGFDLAGMSYIRVFDYRKLTKPFENSSVTPQYIEQVKNAVAAHRTGQISVEKYDGIVNAFTTKLLNPLHVPNEELKLLLHKKVGEPHMQYPHTANNIGNIISEVVLRILNDQLVKDTIKIDLTDQVIVRSKIRNRLERMFLLIKVLTQVDAKEKDAMKKS